MVIYEITSAQSRSGGGKQSHRVGEKVTVEVIGVGYAAFLRYVSSLNVLRTSPVRHVIAEDDRIVFVTENTYYELTAVGFE